MQFEIRRKEKLWEIIPTSGVFSGRVIAQADGVSVRDAAFSNKAVVGEITSTWGLVIDEDAYDDVSTWRALHIGKAFDCKPGHPCVMDFDGYYVGRSRVRFADRVVLLGENVWAKGF